MSAGVDVGNDRLARPVPIRVDHVAGVAVTQQLRVIPRVVGKRTLPRADAGCRDAPLGGTGLAHLRVQTAAWVPTIATVAYSSASLRSPCVHSEALTCTASSEASGRISTDDPPRGHTGGFDHQAGVTLLGRHYPDRERRRVGRGGVGDPVAWRVEVDAADGGTVLHRAQAYRAGQPRAAGCGKRLDDKVFHAVAAANAGGFHRMRQRAVEAEAD